MSVTIKPLTNFSLQQILYYFLNGRIYGTIRNGGVVGFGTA
jgi:hypothetical protein